MKKQYYFFIMLLVFFNAKAADFVVDDFESHSVRTALEMKAWNPEDGTATVVVDPTDASNKVVNIITSNWDAILKLNVVLPTGTTLSDYDNFIFDIYIPSNSEDENAQYKNMNIYIDDEKKYEDEDYPKQAEIETWTTKTYAISSLELTTEEAGKNSFTIAFGISTDKGNYLIDNVRFSGGNNEQPPAEADIFVIEDFESHSVRTALEMKAWNPEDGTATVVVDPTDASNKVVNIVTSNWDALLKLDVVLPEGKILGNFEELLFDIYILTNDEDENAQYKNMNIYIDDEKKYEDEDYPKQADIETWTTKTFLINDLDLSPAEKDKSNFDLSIGMSTDEGDYLIDNIVLTSKATGIKYPVHVQKQMYVVNNVLYLRDMQADNLTVFNLNGMVQASGQALSSLDLSHLNTGVYIVRAVVDGKVLVNKVMKK